MSEEKRNARRRRSAPEIALRKAASTADALVRVEDLLGVTPAAATKALARLAKQGKLERVAKGVYHAPKKTLLGASKPSTAAMVRKTLKDKARPTGASAANLLGLSTQVPARPQLVVFGSNLPTHAGASQVHLRRGARPHALTDLEGALLEFLRDRGAYAETDGQETVTRLANLLKSGLSESRLRKLREAALDEPPRVRATLGALLATAGLPKNLWKPLKESLNPLSKFDFGLLRAVPNALEWQAKMSFLYERDDFPELVQLAAERKGIPNPAIVEKDYFVTEALRILARDFGDQVIFKGGTSLSKGWNLINRFSEDIDLYVSPVADDREGTKARFKVVAEAVKSFTGFIDRGGNERPKDWNQWVERFAYRSQTQGAAGISSDVLLEAGIQSADQPTERRNLTSILSQVLDEAGVEPETDDRQPFPMALLHFRRTFVEKLFTLHSRVVKAQSEGKPLGRDARHYYDLMMLLGRDETRAMLNTPEYGEICIQYKTLTETHFRSQTKYLPEQMDLSASPALFPPEDLYRMLEQEYLREANVLCYGVYPSFQEITNAFAEIRDQLTI